MNQQTTPVNGFERRGPLFVPAFDLERDVHAEPVTRSDEKLGADLRQANPSEPASSSENTSRRSAGSEPAPAPVDGNTVRVQEHKARVAEADRIRALPTERVLARRQALAEAEQLARLDTTDHARRLHIAGERQRAELAARAASAAGKRRLEADTDVRALKLGTLRKSRTAILWTVLGAAMSFTAVGVQKFAAGSSLPWSAQWVVAWLVDPLLSGLVVALLLTRGDLAVFGKPAHETRWDRIVVPLVEIGALVAALLMNVSPEIQTHAAWESVALHIVVPLAAVASALALPVVQRRYAAGIAALYESAVNVTDGFDSTEGVGAYRPDLMDVHGTVHERAPEHAAERPSRTPRRRPRKTRAKRAVRMALADYVDAVRGHLTDDTVVTAAWVMETVHCPRSTAYRVVDALQAERDVAEEVPA